MIRAATLAGVVLAAAPGQMQLTSSDFTAGAALPRFLMAAECGGRNESPALAWSGAPKGTKSFALVLHDADAPVPGGFYHWVVYNLPPAARGLAAGRELSAAQLGVTSARTPGYYGPCPPPGPAHHYTFTLFALDVASISTPALSGSQLEAKIGRHILARTTLLGTASRP